MAAAGFGGGSSSSVGAEARAQEHVLLKAFNRTGLYTETDQPELQELAKKIANLSHGERKRFDELTSELAHEPSGTRFDELEVIFYDEKGRQVFPTDKIAKTALLALQFFNGLEINTICEELSKFADSSGWFDQAKFDEQSKVLAEKLAKRDIELAARFSRLLEVEQKTILSFLPLSDTSIPFIGEPIFLRLIQAFNMPERDPRVDALFAHLEITGDEKEEEKIDAIQKLIVYARDIGAETPLMKGDYETVMKALLNAIPQATLTFFEALPEEVTTLFTQPEGWGEMPLHEQAAIINQWIETALKVGNRELGALTGPLFNALPQPMQNVILHDHEEVSNVEVTTIISRLDIHEFIPQIETVLLDALPDAVKNEFPYPTKWDEMDVVDKNRALFQWIEAGGRMARMTELMLEGKKLTILPSYIGEFRQLTWLDLRCNNLRKLPESLSKLTNLSTLVLIMNKLQRLPPLKSLVNLEGLHVEGNYLTELPEDIGFLKKLNWLDVSRNKLTTLPTSLSECGSLYHLNLSHNELGTIPKVVFSLSRLDALHAVRCSLETLSSDIRLLTNLRRAFFARNHLSTLPKEIGELQALENLYVEDNQLTSFPEEILHAPNLKYVDVHRNRGLFFPRDFPGSCYLSHAVFEDQRW